MNQSINMQLDSLTRINHKVINPYKSGLAIKMLDDYLANSKVSKSILEFSNTNKFKSNNTFLDILYKNTNGKISWFKDYINYNGNVDLSLIHI